MLLSIFFSYEIVHHSRQRNDLFLYGVVVYCQRFFHFSSYLAPTAAAAMYGQAGLCSRRSYIDGGPFLLSHLQPMLLCLPPQQVVRQGARHCGGGELGPAAQLPPRPRRQASPAPGQTTPPYTSNFRVLKSPWLRLRQLE
eukprot:scaffold361635_cov37-Prasinocladus_malaysianus.AAC.1